eukprot:4345954-Ditylum_brightwellii.AAC.1
MATTGIANVLDTNYHKVDLHTDVMDLCKALNVKDKEKSLCILQKHKDLFDGTLGTWKNFQYGIKL